MNTALFRERQYFWNNPMSWIVVAGLFLSATLVISKTNNDASLMERYGIVLINSTVLLLLLIFRLELTVSDDGIEFRFFPFNWKFRNVSWKDIKSVSVRKYNPISEYGGWGIKGSQKNRALSIGGDWGLQVEFPDGKKLLIGTQKHTELEGVLFDLRRKTKLHE